MFCIFFKQSIALSEKGKLLALYLTEALMKEIYICVEEWNVSGIKASLGHVEFLSGSWPNRLCIFLVGKVRSDG